MTSSFSSDSLHARRRGVVVRQYQYVPTQAPVPGAPDAGETSGGNGHAGSGVVGAGSHAESAVPAGPAASEVLAAARHEVEMLRAAAVADAERLREDARRQGYADGFETGLADGLAQADAKTAVSVARLHHIVDSLVAERSRVLGETESDLVGLALAISQKVIGDLAQGSSGVILQLAARAVDLLGHPEAYEVHVSPQDYEVVLAALKDSGVKRTWTLVSDERVTPGGCRVRHGAAQVDARPEAQLELVQKAFDELSSEARCAGDAFFAVDGMIGAEPGEDGLAGGFALPQVDDPA